MTSIQKKIVAAFILFGLILPFVWAGGSSERKKNKAAAKVDAVAIVNDVPILKTVFDRELERMKYQFLMQGIQLDNEYLGFLEEQVLDDLINQELVYQEGLKSGITADEEMVSSQLASIRANFPDDASYKTALTEQSLTEDELVKDISRVYVMQVFIEKHFTDLIQISETEKRDFYNNNPQYFEEPEQVRASHILIQFPPGASAEQKTEARNKIQDLRQRIVKGESFSDLAREFSECPSGKEGGDLGFFQRGDMVSSFEDAAFGLKKGDLSAIIETEYGYHILTVTDKKAASKMSYEDMSSQIEQYLLQGRMQEEITGFIESLRLKAVIENLMVKDAQQ